MVPLLASPQDARDKPNAAGRCPYGKAGLPKRCLLQKDTLSVSVPLADRTGAEARLEPAQALPLGLGLIRAYDTSGRSNLGHASDRGAEVEVAYLRTAEGFGVDFHVRFLPGSEELAQASVDPSAAAMTKRELRAFRPIRKMLRRYRAWSCSTF